MTASTNLLAIEDNTTDFHLLEHHLCQDGLNVLLARASSAAELDDALNSGEWDAILVDYNIPDLDFDDILSRLRAYNPSLPIILMSASLDEKSAADLLKQGVWDIVLKDQFTRLTPTIKRALSATHAQRSHEIQLRRLNRLYVVLNEINEAIVRCTDHESLFSECCRIAVERGGFLLSWLGRINPSTNNVEIVTHGGNAGDYLEHLLIHLGDNGLDRGPTGRALLQGKTNICNNIAQDIRMLPWRDHALKMGYRSSAAFPVKEDGQVRYCLSLYADKEEFFDAEEIRLLDGLSANISHAIDTINAERQRQKAEIALRSSEHWANQIIDSVADSVLVVDEHSSIARANKQVMPLFGYRPEELCGQSIDILVPDHYRAQHQKLFTEYMATPARRNTVRSMELQAQHKNGNLFPVEITLSPLWTDEKHQIITTIRNISERRASEDLKQRDREQQSTLRKLLETTLKGSTLEETLEQCLELVLAISWLSLLPKGGVFLLDEYGKQLRLSVSINLAPEIQSLCAQVQFGCCHCGNAAASGQMQYASCVDEKHEISYPGMVDHGHYSLPIMSNNNVLGVLVLYLPPGFRRDALKEEFLNSVASILAGYIERKQNEEYLRQSAAVLQSTHEGVMVMDLDSRIISVNPAFTNITGFSEAEALGKSPTLLYFGHDNETFCQQLWDTIGKQGFWRGEIRNRRKNGESFPIWLTISAIQNDKDVVISYVGVFSDISQIKQAEERLSHLAHHDALTDLPNRLLIINLLQHSLERTRRQGSVLAVLFIDLDRFKHVNDSLGHAAGDELLKIAAERMRSRARASDTLARLGGDEFVLILEELNDTDAAASVAQDVINLFREPFRLASRREVYVGASIGISIFPEDGATADQLIRNADTAMYLAKENGRNTYRFYTEELTKRAKEHLLLEARLRRAVEKDEMLLHYQPLIANGRCKGMEALVRWDAPDEGMVAPMQFIPLAEETRIIIPLGKWVLCTACAQMKAWLDAGYMFDTMAVNVSSIQFQQPDFVRDVENILQDTGLPARYLELEITESVIMANIDDTEKKLIALQLLGVKLAIDDFGTGHSSLAYLKRFPINKLKIDRSFIWEIPGNTASMEIATTIIAMAKNLKLEILAEGVETPAQLDFLQSQGCDTYQGYLFSRPVPADEIPDISKQVFY